MLTFSLVPPSGLPVGQPIRYAVTSDERQTFDVRFTAADGKLLGARRFARATEAAFDAAPILRRALQFAPTPTGTGFHDDPGRTVTVSAALFSPGAAADAQPLAIAPQRTFLPGSRAVAAPALVMTMPRQRLIAPGERDELTFVSDEALRITVSAEAGDTLTAESYCATAAGLHRFVLDTRDFPGAEHITVDAGACGKVDYTLLPAPEGAWRLAWCTAGGSVEHYTFPVERSVTVGATKQRARAAEGTVTTVIAHERRTVLGSACETQPVLEALGEVVASPKVWVAREDGYEAVDVTSKEVVICRYGELCALEIEICPIRKELLSWN